jgi:hypothetical protein
MDGFIILTLRVTRERALIDLLHFSSRLLGNVRLHYGIAKFALIAMRRSD